MKNHQTDLQTDDLQFIKMETWQLIKVNPDHHDRLLVAECSTAHKHNSSMSAEELTSQSTWQIHFYTRCFLIINIVLDLLVIIWLHICSVEEVLFMLMTVSCSACILTICSHIKCLINKIFTRDRGMFWGKLCI